MTTWQWVFGVVAALGLGWVAALCRGRVRRLHRLHIRTDAARAALDRALERRAAAALAAAGALAPGGHAEAGALLAAAAQARAAHDRETAENALGRVLGALDHTLLPAPVRARLVDAEQLLALTRRVHNDAVRDTRALRTRRLVRWLHLAGTTPMPEYFEIADAEIGLTARTGHSPVVAPPC